MAFLDSWEIKNDFRVSQYINLVYKGLLDQKFIFENTEVWQHFLFWDGYYIFLKSFS
jgi:hypothetical protein